MKKFKVMITWLSTSRGGAEMSVIDLCNFLSSKNISLILLYVSSSKDYLGFPILINKNVKCYFLRINIHFYKILSFFIVLYLCFKEKPDLVHLNFRSVFQESMAAKILGIPTISTVRAIFLDRENVNNFKFVDMVVGVSMAVIRKIIELGYKGKTLVIYNGINIKLLNLFLNSKLNRDKIYLTGRLVKWKRIDWFILAAIQLHKEFKNTNFYIFGEGREEEKLKELIKLHNAGSYIHVLGFIDPNDKILKDMGICVLPSFEEPFGRSLVESVMRGRVTVASNSGAISELIPKKDLLFRRDDFSDFVSKLFLAYKKFNFYEKYFKKLSIIFLKKYKMDRVAEEYFLLYQQLLTKTISNRKNKV